MSRKKVIVRRFASGMVSGYLPSAGFIRGSELEILDLTGRVLRLPLSEIKMASFVRDFNPSDPINPERLLRKVFPARPRTEGLWLRMTFQDDDILEGLAARDISLLDGISDEQGIQMVPPDIRGNVQRLYVPRAAIKAFQVLAVISTAARKKPLPAVEKPEEDDLFSNLIHTRLQ